MAGLQAVRRRYRQNRAAFTTHAARAMLHYHVLSSEVTEALASDVAEVIEDYPDDPRGPSCLVYRGKALGRILHVVIRSTEGWVITVYPPAESEPATWTPDFRRRK